MYEIQKPMLRLFRYLNSYYQRLSFSVFSSVTNKIFDLLPPLMVGWIIDTVGGNAPHWIQNLAGTDDPWRLALLISAMIILIFGGESFFEWLFQKGLPV